MKKLLAVVLIFLILLIVAGGWWRLQLSPVSTDGATKVVVIPKGEGVSAIAQRLKSDNLIHSELVFKLFARQNNLGSKIQAGSYKLSPSMSLKEITDTLTRGTDDVWVTFIEGWRLEEMTEEVAKNFEDRVRNSLIMPKKVICFRILIYSPKMRPVNILPTL
jgi:UPF0755 protein